jgi:hypothetical protein
MSISRIEACFYPGKNMKARFTGLKTPKKLFESTLAKEMMIILSNKDNLNGLVAKESQDSQRILELPKHLSLLKNKTPINHSK